MLSGAVVGISFAYLGLLFAIAYITEKYAENGIRLTNNPVVYTLSIAVFCTSWTFYGSVGRAATTGLDFLPIYLGPTLVFVLWSVIWVRIIRICKANNITSIADFISSRYGKNSTLGGLVTVIAVVGTTPYISLQLKSISTSFTIVANYSATSLPSGGAGDPSTIDTTLFVALALAMFSVLFGTRNIDTSEHQEGLVAAIAFESLVKLCAFLTVGFFVTYGIYDGFADLFAQAAKLENSEALFTVGYDTGYAQWMTMTLLSMAAIIFLPRQFYITAVENTGESHLRTVVWLFPLYLLVINIFVLPIAVSGNLIFPSGTVDADMFVLSVPIFYGKDSIAMFAFIGGLSAASSMVIVAAIALSTMVCNNLVMPALLRWRWVNATERSDLSGLLLTIRRTSIVVILLLGYGYFRFASETHSLVTIGLVSFAAVAQFAPSIIGGMFWKGGSYRGALAGLLSGFAVWVYTLLLPSFAQSGWLPISFIEDGLFGIALLKPYALFGLDGLDDLSHALFWTMLANIGSYVMVSLASTQSATERMQADLFVDVLKSPEERRKQSRSWRGSTSFGELQDLVGRFVGIRRAAKRFESFTQAHDTALDRNSIADGPLLHYAERLLAGAIGSASARVMVGSLSKGEIVALDDVYQILDETTQVIEYSRMVEAKSKELEETTTKLKSANEKLQELDLLKDDFLSTISHELRTPLTSIRAFSEILSGDRSVTHDQRNQFLDVITKESRRLTRLIDQILDLTKMEAGKMDWSMADVDFSAAVQRGLSAMDGLLKENNIELSVSLPTETVMVRADRDQLVQVIINLMSNAVKFCDQTKGRIDVRAEISDGTLHVSVADNGDGILREHLDMIFDKFHQSNHGSGEMHRGTGLGLAICRQIITFFGGEIWADNGPGGGARICFKMPLSGAVLVPQRQLKAEI